jgi:hypothetical protein
VKVELFGTQQIRDTFRGFVPKVQNLALSRLSYRLWEDIKRDVGKHTKPGDDTGKMEQSLTQERFENGFRIFNDLTRAKHAWWVHWGTKPHQIPKAGVIMGVTPGYKKSLMWPGPNGQIHAKRVNHPGYKGDPWFPRAVSRAPGYFDAIINEIKREVP